MKTLSSRSRRACLVGSLLLGTAPALLAADVVLQKVPALTVEEAPGYPENLARQQFGATVETLDAKAGDTSAAAALLSGDPTATYPVQTGTTTLLVALSKIENVGSISLANQGAKGSVSIATSNAKLPADSPQWHPAFDGQLSADPIRAEIGAGEAKYVRLTFNVTEPGRIAGLGVYSTGRISEFTAPRGTNNGDNENATFGLVSYNQTDMHTKARALYVSSGADLKEANKMIDDQTVTSYSFAADDASPTTVIDLGAARSLHHLSAVYAPRAGKMAVYVTSSRPGTSPDGAAQTVTLTDDAFAGMKAVGSSTDDGSLGRAAVDFPETTGRYVVVKWMSEAKQDTGFSVAEIAAIGPKNRTLLAANEGSGDRRHTSDGKTVLDGKTMIDAKDMPGEGPQEQSPAEGPPPSLPQPPPFTFVPVRVPVLVPTSP